MQKKLLAVAVAGALAAPGVAMAQASNVQIYGVIDMSFNSFKLGDSAVQKAGGAAGISSVTKTTPYNGASRWGLRGTEDLGNGLRAFFQMEAGLAPDARPDANSAPAGVGFLGGRNSGIGLQSNSWGQIMIGIWDSPYTQAANATWQVAGSGLQAVHFGIIMGNGNTTGVNPSPNCVGGAFGTNCNVDAEANGTSFYRRVSNVVQYWSPVWSGFQFKIATTAKEFKNQATTTSISSDPTLWSYTLTWSGGPFSAGIAYEEHKGFQAVSTGGTATGNNDAKDTGVMVGGRWNFGMGTIGAGWERLKYGDTQLTAVGAGLTGTNYELKNWVINGDLKVGGNGRLWAGYSKTPGRSSCGTSYLAGGVNDGLCGGSTKATFFSLGYDHNLSKRTALYATYGKIDNGDGRSSAGAGVGSSYYYIAGPAANGAGNTGAIAAGTDVTTYGVGIKHTF